MKNCSSCSFYSAIDPSAGNCRVAGATRALLAAATPAGSCDRHTQAANDDTRRARAA